ncbi:MAG: pilus assembly protein PilM [Desulfitobacterium sp.]
MVFIKKKWVAAINENRWIVAKISRHKKKLTVYHMAELNRSELIPAEDRSVAIVENQDATADVEKALGDWQPQALKHWLRSHKVPVKKLGISISCSGVITRMITLPDLSNKDLDKLLTEQVDQYFTMNISDYIVDYRILEKVQEDGQKRLRVLLVAIPLLEWEKQWKLWDSIGFAPKVTDFSAECLGRLYRYLSGWGEKKNQAPVLDLAIVDLGTDRVEFVLMEHGVFFLYSDIEISLGGVNESDESEELALVSELSETAEQNELGISNESIDSIEPNKSIDASEMVAQNELEERLSPVFNTLTDFLNFFASRHYGKSVDKIYITGECADYKNLEELFEKNMGIQSKVGFPEDWKPKFTRKSSNFADRWMKYGSLFGLVTRED